jgi:hypothetical protein
MITIRHDCKKRAFCGAGTCIYESSIMKPTKHYLQGEGQNGSTKKIIEGVNLINTHDMLV